MAGDVNLFMNDHEDQKAAEIEVSDTQISVNQPYFQKSLPLN